MPRHSPFRIQLTREERRALEARARKYTSPYRDVIRAKLVLLAAEGLSNDVIAARLDTPRQIISKWRHRFFDNALRASMRSREAGAQPAFPPNVVVEVKRIACERPMDAGVPARAVVVAGPAPRSPDARDRRHRQRHDAVAVAGCGRDPTLAPSQLALPARSAVRRAGRSHPGSLCRPLGRPPLGAA